MLMVLLVTDSYENWGIKVVLLKECLNVGFLIWFSNLKFVK